MPPEISLFFSEVDMKLSELNLAILQWSDDRQISKHSTAYLQVFKTSEEVMELIEAQAKHSTEGPGHNEYLDEIKDAIGDIYVTLIVGMSCCGEEGREVAEVLAPSLSLVDLTQRKYISCGLINLGKTATTKKTMNPDYLDQVEWMVNILDHIAKSYGTRLAGCVEQAYNEIKDRKGSLNAQGIFVKEQA